MILFWEKLTIADSIRFSFPKSGYFLLFSFSLHYLVSGWTQNCVRYFPRVGSIIRDVISYPFLYIMSLQYGSIVIVLFLFVMPLGFGALLTLWHEEYLFNRGKIVKECLFSSSFLFFNFKREKCMNKITLFIPLYVEDYWVCQRHVCIELNWSTCLFTVNFVWCNS